MLSCISLAKRANIIADEWATGKFDGKANTHPGPPLATPLGGRGWTGGKWLLFKIVAGH